ncbi:conserved membrane hypothetical protein [Candidatus Desulfarcum epimagneticum]|uniref:YeeE/YedE family protein n=1 Tax=uncultured Desulfobacteraceae bacterium TaxID=218296 RepID=A0A484HDU3_9BACT|nr:conserved membrane hypothetical protein [uncultured Desulfobacteraceae bacterium]
MEETSFLGFAKEDIKRLYSHVFENNWPFWLGGIFMAILVLMIFLWNFPWGVTGGYRNWIEWIGYGVKIKQDVPDLSPLLHPVSASNGGIILGAIVSALLSRQFKWQIASGREYLKGIIGGSLMGVGVSMTGGCLGGAFYSGIGVLSLGGFTMIIGVMIGAFFGLKLVLWEVESLPAPKQRPQPEKSEGFDWKKVHPGMGIALFFIMIGVIYVYSYFDQAKIGGLLLLGLLIGIVMHRTRFCFVRVFRCPLMTGDGEMVKTACLSLAIYALGSSVIKWAYMQPDTMGVYQPVGLGTIGGGILFGTGMILLGSCASSALWRMGEGNTKIIVGLFCFSIANAVSRSLFMKWDIYSYFGPNIFIPELISWHVTLPLYALFFIGWALLANWNEETEKFVIF